MERIIEADLEKLKTDVLTAFHMAQAGVEKSLRTVFERDPEPARAVIASDAAIDALECTLDAEILRLLALYQPVARDLRYILGCMRTVGDIERIGDQAVGVAHRGLWLVARDPLAPPARLEELAEATRDFLSRTAVCFAELDMTLARRLCEESEDILELNVAILKEMTEFMRDEARPVERAVQISFIAHALKRVCDQCTNIAESVVFISEGACSRHRCD
ncbi:phosphate signaling complex protein PhoU [Solidesulfovibrio sp.]|uniref:phosphate signaling complex protein PhoU n=1 Tax=Solidesulfovibrio sp. TaxID=2910990 RepID=UPI002B204B5A|nr:phosphate signaling complex protein PhoU [Solidesulfovibrio sp.]MEA5090079.1 phosphate signaling complex protein PhoU [Solidesulfovibrio sp.]HML59783.1 phosphate signaling complex protein PhoU [Solidesulfovibrio sp.]